MKNTLKTILSLALGAFFFLGASANQVDIGIYQVDGNLEVKVKPQADFDGIFSSVVFTIRWDKNSGAELGDMIAAPGMQIPMAKSGQKHEEGVYNYQVFSGVGFQTLASQGVAWEAGKEYTILTIPYTGSAEFELVNDAWTNVPENNADFYVSLGGKDETGVIYKRTTGIAESLDSTVMIQPNPNNGVFNFSFNVANESDLEVEVVNTLGQVMYTNALKNFSGRFAHDMDLTDESNGVYYLKIKQGENTPSVHKIVFR